MNRTIIENGRRIQSSASLCKLQNSWGFGGTHRKTLSAESALARAMHSPSEDSAEDSVARILDKLRQTGVTSCYLFHKYIAILSEISPSSALAIAIAVGH